MGTLLFALAVAHTFAVKQFQSLARRFPEGSIRENLFHLLGEVEVVFGFWAGIIVYLLQRFHCEILLYAFTAAFIGLIGINQDLINRSI